MTGESCCTTIDPTLPHFAVPKAFALDMDRTLVQVPAGVSRLVEVGSGFGIDSDQIKTAQRAKEADGGSFDPLQFIEAELTDNEFTDFGDKFIRAGHPPLTYPDTELLFNRLLGGPATPHLLVTYGINRLWQAIKVAGSGCYGYTEIMDHTVKGPQIASWRGWQGTFDFVGLSEDEQPVAVYHAQSVELVDDKAKSFTGMPPNTTGAHLVRPGETRMLSQQGDIPPHLQSRVRVIPGLGELSVPKTMAMAPCNRSNFFDPSEMPEPFAFRPAYPTGETNPGLLITPAMSFTALQATVEYL
jgi:hypothetical protein